MSIDDLNCTIERAAGIATRSQRRGTWRVDGAVGEGHVSFFDQRTQTVQVVTVGGHLREVLPGTYYVVGIRIQHIDLWLPPPPGPGEPIPGGPTNPGQPAQPTPEPLERPAQMRHGGAGDLN